MTVVKVVPQPRLHVGQVGLTVTVGVLVGQHLPLQPSVMVDRMMQSGWTQGVSRGQLSIPVLVLVMVGQAGITTVETGQVDADVVVVVMARAEEMKL